MAERAGWSVTKMAKLCQISARTLERHFLKTMDTTPRAWMAEQRLERATELLGNGYSVKETAARMGYKYAANFSRKLRTRKTASRVAAHEVAIKP